MDWRYGLITPTGAGIGALTAAKSRKLVFNLDDVATASFQIDGFHPQAALIEELQTDLVVYDTAGTARFRGRMGTSSDTVAAAGHQVTFSAVDYRGMLSRRMIWPGKTIAFTEVDQAQIAWQLIADAQSLSGGNYGITQGVGFVGGVGTTGVVRTRNYQAGTPIGTLIKALGDTTGGFEWEVDANLVFNLYYPLRGTAQGLTLTYPGSILSFQRQLATTTFANAIRYSGATTLVPVTETAPAFGAAGRWEKQIGDTSIGNQSTLTQKALYELALDETVSPSYQVVLKPGWWTPEKLWLGDTATLVLKSGRLNVNHSYRATQIQVTTGDDGGQTVTVTFGPVIPTDTTDSIDILRRLSTLEHR